MKKTVFFDLGNVLLFFSHKKMCAQIAHIYGTSAEIVHDLLFRKKLAERYEEGELSSEMLHEILCKTLKKQVSLLEFLHAASDIFEPNSSLFPVVRALKKNQVQLILLSNTCEAHYNFAYSHFPILKLFDGFLLSYELKLKKPDPKIFEKALALSSKEEGFYTDDLRENILSARKVGLDAERFTDTLTLTYHLQSRGFLSPPS